MVNFNQCCNCKTAGLLCFATGREGAEPWQLDWEGIARVSILCAILKNAGYFELPPPTSSSLTSSKKRIKRLRAKAMGVLISTSFLILAFGSAIGDKRMAALISLLEGTLKSYNLLVEGAKVFFK